MKRRKRISGKMKTRRKMQWAEKEKLAKSFEQKRMEGFSLKTEAMQKVAELMLHGRMW